MENKMHSKLCFKYVRKILVLLDKIFIIPHWEDSAQLILCIKTRLTPALAERKVKSMIRSVITAPIMKCCQAELYDDRRSFVKLRDLGVLRSHSN